MKLSKKKLLLISTSILSIAPISAFVISCSSNDDGDKEQKPPVDDGDKPGGDQNKPSEPDQPSIPTNELGELVEARTITIKLANLDAQPSDEILKKYQNNIKEISKLFTLINQSSYENISYQLTKAPIIDFDNSNIKVTFKFTNNENSETYTKTFTFTYRFGTTTTEQYYENVYNAIANNLKLNETYNETRLIDLFKQFQTNTNFINNCLLKESEVLKNIIGITYKVTIPSQTLDASQSDSNYLRLTLNIYNNSVTVTPRVQNTYLRIANDDLRDTFTIVNDNDLNKESINLVSNQYLGQLFFRSEQNLSNVEINFNFSNKEIIGEVDFSKFQRIVFNSSFQNNKITAIKFNSNATVVNLNNNKFKNNYIKEIDLPSSVSNYSSDCFDDTVSVYGLQAIIGIDRFFNQSTNVLDLRNISSNSELKNVFNIVLNTNKKRGINQFEKIYMPRYEFSDADIFKKSINVKELYLYDDQENPYYFERRLSWTIEKVIVPSSIIRLSQRAFDKKPSSVERSINSSIKNLVVNNTLEINGLKEFSYKDYVNNNEVKVNNDNNFIYDIDEYLQYSNIGITTIKFDINFDINVSTSSVSSFLYDKEIIFSSNVKTIDYRFYSSLKSNNQNITRENALGDAIQNGVLYLSRLYETNSSLSNVLVGYETLINTINTSNVNTIKSSTFKELKGWEKISITLDNSITTIESNAFKNSDIKILQNNFNPTKIETYAFSNSTISGDLEFTNLTSLGSYAFYNSKQIGRVIFNNIDLINSSSFYGSSITYGEFNAAKNIYSSAFRNCSSLEQIKIDNVSSFQHASNGPDQTHIFYGCSKLSSITLSPLITKIPDNTFYGCKALTTFDFSNIKTIGASSFYNSGLSSIDLSNVDEIGKQAFANCSSLSGDVNFKDNVKLGENIFNNVSNITSVNNFDLSKYKISLTLGPSFKSVFKNISMNEIYKEIGYDESTKILDMSSLNMSTKILNSLRLFSNEINKNDSFVFEKVVLPNAREINDEFASIFSNKITINRIEWDYETKSASKSLVSLLGNAKINLVPSNFLVGMQTLPSGFLNGLNIENNTLNLLTVSKVGSNALRFNSPVTFINTNVLNTIDSNAFNQNAIINIPANVKLNKTSFGSSTSSIINNPSYKVTRENIFDGSSIFWNIYNQETKTIDLSKITNAQDLNKYSDIGSYLINGDVETLILPKLPIINSSSIFSNLGTIKNIVFNNVNQVILKGAFTGTTILNKPSQADTHILLDLDNFFT